MRRTSRSASDDSRTLPDATQWSGVARPVQSPTAMRFGPSTWATASIESPSRIPRPVVSWVSRASRSSSGRAIPRRSSVRSARSARRMTTRPSRYLPVSSSCSTRPRFWSVASRREAVDLCRPEPAGELGHAGLALALAEGEQQRRRPVDRADGVAVEDHAARPVQPAAGCAIAPTRRRRRWPRRGRAPRAPRRASPRRSTRPGRRCRPGRAPRR